MGTNDSSFCLTGTIRQPASLIVPLLWRLLSNADRKYYDRVLESPVLRANEIEVQVDNPGNYLIVVENQNDTEIIVKEIVFNGT